MTRCKHLFALLCWLLFTVDVTSATLPVCSDMPMGSRESISQQVDIQHSDVSDPHAHHRLANEVNAETIESDQLPATSTHDCCEIDCSDQCAPIQLSAVAINHLVGSYADTAHQPLWDLHSSIHPSFNSTPFRPPISR